MITVGGRRRRESKASHASAIMNVLGLRLSGGQFCNYESFGLIGCWVKWFGPLWDFAATAKSSFLFKLNSICHNVPTLCVIRPHINKGCGKAKSSFSLRKFITRGQESSAFDRKTFTQKVNGILMKYKHHFLGKPRVDSRLIRSVQTY